MNNIYRILLFLHQQKKSKIIFLQFYFNLLILHINKLYLNIYMEFYVYY